MQTISIIYFFFDLLPNQNYTLSFIILALSAPFCILSLYNSLIYIELSKRVRLFLSIWSSLIMMIFGIYYFIKIIGLSLDGSIQVENTVNFIQYFFLGTSIIYIIKNSYMIVVYIPSRGRFFNNTYLKEISKMNKKHIDRYSKEQISQTNTFLIICFSLIIYTLNFFHNFLSSYTIIWLVFFITPFLLSLKKSLTSKGNILE